jgi:hypothetical protein
LLTRGQGQHEHLQQTVLEPPLTPNGNDGECSENYDLLAMLIKHLPRDGKWTSVERDNYIKAYTAVLDLLTEVIDESK